MRFNMPWSSKDRPVVDEPAPQDAENVAGNKETFTSEKHETDSTEEPNVEYQHGDEAIRAMTQVWTKKHLIIAYIL
jgi:hypothetical protein